VRREGEIRRGTSGLKFHQSSSRLYGKAVREG
jgi:hypothetical protein